MYEKLKQKAGSKIKIIPFEVAKRAAATLKRLDEIKFFGVYSSFTETKWEINSQFAHVLDRGIEYMSQAAERYFRVLFERCPACPSVEVTIEAKSKEASGINVS